tara:strand:- start:9311 stop:10300 length:990 start_codon:yes stop_codon:yes gene_type:complete
LFRFIHKSSPSILPVTDILIGDMSDINYEFLLTDRPIILLSNNWLDKNFPDLGFRIKNPSEIGDAIYKVTDNDIFSKNRAEYKKQAFFVGNNTNSFVTLKKIILISGIPDPKISIHHKNNEIYKSNLCPLIEVAKNLGIDYYENNKSSAKDMIHIAAHFKALLDKNISNNFCVHLDHGLKGDGTANVEMSIKDYKKNNFFPSVDLHITAGKMGQKRTQMLLGPNKDRAIEGGYPKADEIINSDNQKNRILLCNEYGLDPNLPIITYASAGEVSHEKPGGSLSKKTINELRKLSKNGKYNIIVKLKYKNYFIRRSLSSLKARIKKKSFFK